MHLLDQVGPAAFLILIAYEPDLACEGALFVLIEARISSTILDAESISFSFYPSNGSS